MAITPIPNREVSNKEWVRSHSANGANSYTGNPMPVANTISNDGAPTNAQLYSLDLTGSESVSFYSSVTGLTTTLNGKSTSTQAAKALGSIVGNGTTVVLESAKGVYLENTTTNFVFLNNTGQAIDVPVDAFGIDSAVVASGATAVTSWNGGLPANISTPIPYTAHISGTASIVSGTLTTGAGSGFFAGTISIDAPANTNLTYLTAAYITSSGTGTVSWTNATAPYSDNLAETYPSYVGTPYAAPTWVDDATVHAYEVTGNGSVIQDTTRVVQKQVRQINTGEGPDGGLETQQYNAYFANYQSNLNQTQQKNTKQQQC
jgi:hypothetical protein